MIDDTVLFGRLVETTSYIDHISRIYIPHNTYTISRGDFAIGRVNVYGSPIQIFQTDKVEKGTVYAAIFKEDEAPLGKSVQECHPVNDDEDKKLSGTPVSEEKIEGANGIEGSEIEQEESDETKEELKEFRHFEKEYLFESKKKHNDEDVKTKEIKRTYKYPSFSYESKYLETIIAEYDDETERLELTLRTEDVNTVISAVSEALGLDVSKIRLTGLSYSSSFDEYFISTLRATIIAAKAAEKYGKKVILTYRPKSISPSFEIKRSTLISEDGENVYSEDIDVNVDVGNSFILSEDIGDIISSCSAPLYSVKRLKINVCIKESSSPCTLFFSSLLKAVPSSSASEHAHNIAFALGLDPVLFIEKCLNSEGKGDVVHSHSAIKTGTAGSVYSSMVKNDDIYMQSAVFMLNDKKNKIFLSPMSAINKAVVTSVAFIPNGISRSFEKRNSFSILTQKDADGDRRFYLGSSSDEDNKDRIENALKQYEDPLMRASISIMPRGYKGKPFSIGPDVMSRHTSVVARKIKELVENPQTKALSPILQGTRMAKEGAEVWGVSAVNGYKDFVSDELVITAVHMVLPHSTFFSTSDDYMYYKRMMLKVFSLFKVRFAASFDDKKDVKIEFIDRESVFDSVECVFPLMLSSLRLLSFYLSPNRKKLTIQNEDAPQTRDSEADSSVNAESEEKETKEEEENSDAKTKVSKGESNDDKL